MIISTSRKRRNCEVLSKDILKMACPSLIHSHINYCGAADHIKQGS